MSDFSSQNSSSKYVAALQRAKQIAAKIHTSSGQGTKRPLEEGSDSDNKRFNSSSDYNASSMSSAVHAAQVAAQVSARLNQSNNQGNSNTNSSVNSDAIQKAKELISKMVNPNAGAPNMGGPNNGPSGGSGGGGPRPGLGSNSFTEIMIPGAKVGLVIGKGGETIKQLQEKTGAKMVVIQDGPGQEMEKPLRITGDPQKVEHAKQLVYELIQDKGEPAQNQRPNFNNNGGGMNSMGGPGGGPGGSEQTEIFVPKAAVGVVIGKGGDMIKKIQNETGCKLQFIQGKGDGPGDRRCIVQGSKKEVDDGKRMIEELIESVLRRNGGNPQDAYQNAYGANNQNGSAPPAQGGIQVVHEQYQFVVPASKCGIIIGRGGDTIKQINQQSGAYCEMDRKTSANQTVEKTFTIKGEQHQVDEAKRLISEKINLEISLVHIGSSTVTVTQPVNQNNFGQPSAQNPYQQAWGYGTAQSWDQNQAQANVMGQAAGQQDYSQQWIEYYRQMGMHREADMIEQQVKAKQAAGQLMVTGATTAPTNGANVPSVAGQVSQGQSQQDYSAEWAEYYRRIGRTDEAEAIEKHIQAAKPGYPAAANPQLAAYQQYQQYYGASAAGGQAYQQQFPGYPAQPGQPQQPAQPPSQPNQGGNKNDNW